MNYLTSKISLETWWSTKQSARPIPSFITTFKTKKQNYIPFELLIDCIITICCSYLSHWCCEKYNKSTSKRECLVSYSVMLGMFWQQNLRKLVIRYLQWGLGKPCIFISISVISWFLLCLCHRSIEWYPK